MAGSKAAQGRGTLAEVGTGMMPARKGSPYVIEIDDVASKPIVGKNKHWGYHLILDCSSCNKKIDDEAAVKAFIADLVKALKMKTLGPVTVERAPKEEGRGLSAVQIITTSTITFHGDDDEWCAYIDVFSCQPYAPKTALDCVQKHFAPKHIGKAWLHRDAGRWPEK